MRLLSAYAVSFCILHSVFCILPSAFCAEGAVKGSIKYDGDPPPQQVKEIPADKQKDCRCATVPSEALVVDKNTRGIQWAIVRVMGVEAPAAPPANAEYKMDQQGCKFTPHVLVVPPGSDVHFQNPDKVFHNIHTLPFDGANIEKNIAQGPEEETKLYKGKLLASPEIVQLQCDIHGWMKGFIVVHDPRFCAVTGADGAFEIKGVPPGKYTVLIYQESCGEKKLEVEIKAGETADLGEIKFNYNSKAKK